MGKIKLKPCPFCPDGGDIEVQSYREGKSRISPYRADIMCCYCRTERYAYGSTEETAIENAKKSWNTRYERTCEMPMVYEDDEGNELDSSAACFRHYRCSNCGEIMEHYKHEHWYKREHWSYCPNCGLKVVEYR